MTQPTMMELGYILMGMGDSSFYHYHQNYAEIISQRHFCETNLYQDLLYSPYVLYESYIWKKISFISCGHGKLYEKSIMNLGNGNVHYKEIPLEEIDEYNTRVKWKINNPVNIDSNIEAIDKFLAQE